MVVLAITLAVSGWYYLRNLIGMGRLFVGGWEASREIIWWQDPGYRTIQQCYILKEALIYPVYSSIHGFWDAIYSSFWMDGFLSCYNRVPWNYSFMLSSAWLSILPAIALIIGCTLGVVYRKNGQVLILRFAAYSVLVYLTAIFYIFLKVPILGSAKATYALGLTPCFALLAAAGFDVLFAKTFRAGFCVRAFCLLVRCRLRSLLCHGKFLNGEYCLDSQQIIGYLYKRDQWSYNDYSSAI